MNRAIALTIAGSDPSGGAGIQADLKTFHQLGVYGEAAITLITVQNTRGVERVETLDPDLVGEQIRAVLEDIPPGAAKTGALGNDAVSAAVAKALEGANFPVVVDPVMRSQSGVSLGPRHFPRAFLITPNLAEASELAGMEVHDLASMHAAAERILKSTGARNVLITGGHLTGEPVDLLLAEDGGTHKFRAGRVETRHTHGTGCTFSAGITAELAKGTDLVNAVERAKKFVSRAIRTNPGFGAGSGPLNHFA